MFAYQKLSLWESCLYPLSTEAKSQWEWFILTYSSDRIVCEANTPWGKTLIAFDPRSLEGKTVQSRTWFHCAFTFFTSIMWNYWELKVGHKHTQNILGLFACLFVVFCFPLPFFSCYCFLFSSIEKAQALTRQTKLSFAKTSTEWKWICQRI